MGRTSLNDMFSFCSIPRTVMGNPRQQDFHDLSERVVGRRLGVNFGDRIVAEGRRRGRGAATNISGRFESEKREDFDDGWSVVDELPPFKTEVILEKAKTIITRNDSPDISFDRSINPYRGCEHGCVYCYARPTHAYLGLSPG